MILAVAVKLSLTDIEMDASHWRVSHICFVNLLTVAESQQEKKMANLHQAVEDSRGREGS